MSFAAHHLDLGFEREHWELIRDQILIVIITCQVRSDVEMRPLLNIPRLMIDPVACRGSFGIAGKLENPILYLNICSICTHANQNHSSIMSDTDNYNHTHTQIQVRVEFESRPVPVWIVVCFS